MENRVRKKADEGVGWNTTRKFISEILKSLNQRFQPRGRKRGALMECTVLNGRCIKLNNLSHSRTEVDERRGHNTSRLTTEICYTCRCWLCFCCGMRPGTCTRPRRLSRRFVDEVREGGKLDRSRGDQQQTGPRLSARRGPRPQGAADGPSLFSITSTRGWRL